MLRGKNDYKAQLVAASSKLTAIFMGSTITKRTWSQLPQNFLGLGLART